MATRSLVKRYDALSMRERALVALGALGLIMACWDSLLMEPLRTARTNLEAELATAGSFGVTAQSDDVTDPRQLSMRRVGELQTQLQNIDARLANTASTFVPSERMIEVLHDMLSKQAGIELVSIRNLPVTSLIKPAEVTAPMQPPYVHSIEIVIDGQYADILEYLAQLETLPWKFRWTSLDLTTSGYPRNRVRIELSTLSLDATWLGV